MKNVLLMVFLVCFCCSATVWAEGGSGHGDAPHWGYLGETGPAHWGELKAEFSACQEGRSQSPINIVNAVDIDLPQIKFAYQPTSLSLINNGHTVQANYAPGSKITVAGQSYDLLQFHFHTLSENAVNGKLFPLEAHLVHRDQNGKLGVVGVLFELGESNPLLAQLWRYMPAVGNSTVEVPGVSINVLDLLPKSKEYYSWSGSLTTPPCTEGVAWMLLRTPVTVSAAQVAELERTLGFKNNRPVQPLYNRTVNK